MSAPIAVGTSKYVLDRAVVHAKSLLDQVEAVPPAEGRETTHKSLVTDLLQAHLRLEYLQAEFNDLGTIDQSTYNSNATVLARAPARIEALYEPAYLTQLYKERYQAISDAIEKERSPNVKRSAEFEFKRDFLSPAALVETRRFPRLNAVAKLYAGEGSTAEGWVARHHEPKLQAEMYTQQLLQQPQAERSLAHDARGRSAFARVSRRTAQRYNITR